MLIECRKLWKCRKITLNFKREFSVFKDLLTTFKKINFQKTFLHILIYLTFKIEALHHKNLFNSFPKIQNGGCKKSCKKIILIFGGYTYIWLKYKISWFFYVFIVEKLLYIPNTSVSLTIELFPMCILNVILFSKFLYLALKVMLHFLLENYIYIVK